MFKTIRKIFKSIESILSFRLIDSIIFAPIQFISSFYIENEVLRWYIRITSIMNILYNTHNYYYFEKGKFNTKHLKSARLCSCHGHRTFYAVLRLRRLEREHLVQ